MKSYVFFVLFIEIALSNIAQTYAENNGSFQEEPPTANVYQSERREDETKKYIDPKMEPDVVISSLEIEGLKRRITALETRVDQLTISLNEVIMLLNEKNKK